MLIPFGSPMTSLKIRIPNAATAAILLQLVVALAAFAQSTIEVPAPAPRGDINSPCAAIQVGPRRRSCSDTAAIALAGAARVATSRRSGANANQPSILRTAAR